MALVKAENLSAQVTGFNRLPMVRQLGLMVGIAVSIALAVVIILWSQQPSYRMLYGNLDDQQVMEISNILDQSGIKYEINQATGAVMVDGSRLYDARLKLAGAGLPRDSGVGYELLHKEQGFGTSQFIETARYQQALEGELSKTITSISAVKGARVHLALPKQSAFVRNKKRPSASVVVTLNQGRTLSPDQAASVTHLVASSVPGMLADDVTLVDHTGRLLSMPGSMNEMRYTATQFDYRKNLEEYYTKRIENILMPILGADGMRAQVVADLDFTVTEKTQEAYNPDLPSIRSEQTIEELNQAARTGLQGVPGALTNQPPEDANLAQNGALQGTDSSEQSIDKNSSRRVVRNYELDRTVSHTKLSTGTVTRLSVAVVVDNMQETNDAGEVVSRAMTQEEIDRITSLVREAVGYRADRGDSVNVINAPFQQVAEPEPLPEPSLFEQPWVWDIIKQLAAIVAIILLIFTVIKPVLTSLAKQGKRPAALPAGAGEAAEGMGAEQLALAGGGAVPALPGGKSYEDQLADAKAVVTQDPRRVAEIVKGWVEADAG